MQHVDKLFFLKRLLAKFINANAHCAEKFCQSRMSLSTGFVWQGVWGGCLRPLKYACGRVGLQTMCSGKQYKNKQKCASWLVKCLHSKMWSISGRTCIEGLFLVCTIFYFALLHCVALSRTKTVSRLDVLLTVRTVDPPCSVVCQTGRNLYRFTSFTVLLPSRLCCHLKFLLHRGNASAQ